MPVECDEEEIEQGFQSTMEAQYYGTFTKSYGMIVTFPDQEEPTVGAGPIITFLIFIGLALLVIFGTVVDRTDLFRNPTYVVSPEQINEECCVQYTSDDHNRKTKLGNFFSSFSVPRNFTRIFFDDFTMQKELRVFNGVFVISLILVILNNIYFISAMYGIVESSRLLTYEQKFPEFILLRLHLSYDIYFFSIGFIFTAKIWSLYFVNHHKGSIFIELLRLIYRRFIPMIFLLLFSLFMFQFVGSGPLYQF